MSKSRTKEEMIALVAKFIEELKIKSLDKPLSVLKFSPGNWFNDKGITDKGFPKRILDYLSNNVLQRDGEKAGQTFKWIKTENTNYEYLAECAYDNYRQWISNGKPIKSIKNKVVETKIISSQRFSIDDKVVIMHDNLIRKVQVMGINKLFPYDKTAEVVITVWSKNLKPEINPDPTLVVKVTEVFRTFDDLMKSLSITSY